MPKSAAKPATKATAQSAAKPGAKKSAKASASSSASNKSSQADNSQPPAGQLIWLPGQKGKVIRSMRQALAQALAEEWADDPMLEELAQGDGFDLTAQAALRHWQAGVGLMACGLLGPCSAAHLGLNKSGQPPATDALPWSEASLRRLFPSTKPANVARYWPYLKAAFAASGAQPDAMLLALAILRVQAEGLVPQEEPASHLNTPPGGLVFGLLEAGQPLGDALGNRQAGDGARFKGRGYVPLRGRKAYESAAAGLQVPGLLSHPDYAASPELAALALAWHAGQCLKQEDIKNALRVCLNPTTADDDPAWAQTCSNCTGSELGLALWRVTLKAALALWPSLRTQTTAGTQRKKAVAKASAARRESLVDANSHADGAEPLNKLQAKTNAKTQAGDSPDASADDDSPPSQSGKVKKDPPDLRDRPYLPPPVSLAPVFPAEAGMADLLKEYTAAGLILDQGSDGACTGFGLACVMNYLRWRRHRQSLAQAPAQAKNTAPFRSVSARMLYTMARRHDEYAGEDYEGSSCRGALKGLHHHGVCLDDDWGNGPEDRPALGYARRATQNTLGVYYRVPTDSITDMQAAIQEVGAVYASVWVHGGWQQRRLGKRNEAVPTQHADLPRIPFSGMPSRESGHAIALVGYNADGFVVQNSWGTDWGRGGFAVLRYADWLSNALDAWVVALGVPGVVGGRIQAAPLPPKPAASASSASSTSTASNKASTGKGATSSGKSLAAASANSATAFPSPRPATSYWSPQQALDHSLLVGLDGRISRYMTEDVMGRHLQHQVFGQANAWFRQQARHLPANKPVRLVIRAHSGLENQTEALKIAQSWGAATQSQGGFPLYLVWHSGLKEKLNRLIHEAVQQLGSETSHRQIETALREGLGRAVWMDTHAAAHRLFEPTRAGDHLLRALAELNKIWPEQLNIELEADLAGALLIGHLLSNLPTQSALLNNISSVRMHHPITTTEFANKHFASKYQIMEKISIATFPTTDGYSSNSNHLIVEQLPILIANALETDIRAPLIGARNIYNNRTQNQAKEIAGSSTAIQSLSLWLASCKQLKSKIS